MRNVVVEDAAAAVEGIKDGDAVMMGGFGGAGLPLGVVKAVLDRGVLCQACVGGHFTQAVRRRCKGNSLTASSLAAFELWLHTTAGAYGPVGRFVCPSRFLAGKMAEAGVYPDRLRWLPHFMDCAAIEAKHQHGNERRSEADERYAGAGEIRISPHEKRHDQHGGGQRILHLRRW